MTDRVPIGEAQDSERIPIPSTMIDPPQEAQVRGPIQPLPQMPSPRAQVHAALAKAQANITNPPRNREVKVKIKTGGQYTFRYSTLDTIIEHIRKPLTDNGLWFVQRLESNGEGKYHLVTELVHASGQSIASKTPLLVEGGGNQQFGSALTYMRRYALCALLGIAADEDDDANAADGNTVKESADIDPHFAKSADLISDDPGLAERNKPTSGPRSLAELKKALKNLHHDINAAADIHELNGLLLDQNDLIELLKRERPISWKGAPESDQPGLEELIDNKRAELDSLELERMNPLGAG